MSFGSTRTPLCDLWKYIQCILTSRFRMSHLGAIWVAQLRVGHRAKDPFLFPFRNIDGCSEPESGPESEHGGYYHIRGTSGRSLLCFPCACGMSDADISSVRDARSSAGFFGHFLSRFLPRGSSHQEGKGPGHTNVLECPRGSCEVMQARCMR